MDKDIQHGKYRTHDNHDNARYEAFRASGYRSVVDHLLSIWDTLSLMPSTTKRRGLCNPSFVALANQKGCLTYQSKNGSTLLSTAPVGKVCTVPVCPAGGVTTLHDTDFWQDSVLSECALPRLYSQPGVARRGRGVNLDRESEGNEQRSIKENTAETQRDQ